MINQIKQRLLSLDDPAEIHDVFKSAAVLMPLIRNQFTNEWEVIFTRRADHLKHHPGQISFPGGGYEADDQKLSVTAKRETWEEIGIQQDSIELIGKLPQQETISRYYVTPFVGVVDDNSLFQKNVFDSSQLTIDSNEVAEVFTAPLEFVINKQNQQLVTKTFEGTEYSFYVIQYQDYYIWGATAKILNNLTNMLDTKLVNS
ncbi:MAG: CoA pyrophosphatase [Gammaproteobacteria bacterium]|nr:CoA pyrophosphatase [Gammaproteobacteria bacterium]MDH5629743.1 CoA pyrophosphatase [Gammaproteobacteria bacterium]